MLMFMPSFGALPDGDRLKKIKASAHYQQGGFENIEPTPMFTQPDARWSSLLDVFQRWNVERRPLRPIAFEKVYIKNLDPAIDLVIWLGHSSFYVQAGGKRILIDPVLSNHAAPFSFMYRAFDGSDFYKAPDMPAIDLLLLSHDHWDHVDYPTLTQLRDQIGVVVTPLGVGAHLDRWGFNPDTIHELDWNERVSPVEGLEIDALPARHFSGRALSANKSLWASFMIHVAGRRIYYSGDSGYGSHFVEIGQRFGGVDLAIMENGQYDERWAHVHMFPEEVVQAAIDLGAKALMPAHSGKFALGRHAWDEPLRRLHEASVDRPFKLLTPRIGGIVLLDDNPKAFSRWWEE